MAWFRVDDKLHDHPKVRKLRGHKMACLGLWTACGSWSADNLSDGFVPAEIVHRFDPDESLADRLVSVGLWVRHEHDGEGGYLFHQWTDHQPTRAEVERRREEARDRMRRRRAGGTAERPPEPDDVGSQDVRANTSRTSVEVRHPDPTRPEVPNGTPPAAAAPPKADDGFAAFWAAYPRKMKKQDAEKAWAQVLRRDVDPAHVIAQAVAQAARWATEGRQAQYIPYPASWLRGGSYDDELDTGPRDIWTIPDDQLTDDDVDTLVGGSNMPPEPPDEFWTWPLEQRHDWNRANVRQWRAERREKAIRERARRLGGVTRLDDHRRDAG